MISKYRTMISRPRSDALAILVGRMALRCPRRTDPFFCTRRLDVNEFYVLLCFACFDAFLHSMFPCRAFLCHPKSAGDGPDFYFYVMHVLF